jgi:hypothetical protein
MKQFVWQMSEDMFGQQPVAHITLAEYALKPMGVSEYHLTQALPDKLKPGLRRIEDIGRRLGRSGDE